jgi:hypothetical protein
MTVSPTSALPLWLQYGQAIALVAIPMVGAWIAWQQMQISRAKLKGDLYDRRYKIYEATRDILSHTLVHAAMSNDSFREFSLRTEEATFLFRGDVVEFLKSIRTNASSLLVFGDTLRQGGLNEDQRRDYAHRKAKALEKLNEEIERMQAVFRPYLRLDHL